MIIYFHESKFPRLDTPETLRRPWVAHWTRSLMLERITKEAIDTMGLVYRAQLRERKIEEKKVSKTVLLNRKEKGKLKKEKKKIVVLDFSSEEDNFLNQRKH
ncbi:uncharacterized protein DS421_15g499120 [Arachis hypogaea]|nr:uncharacterized protein DS421_15g499120 [Arachis hypogaea]